LENSGASSQLLQELRSMGFDDTEILSIISNACGSYTKTPDKRFVFSKTEIHNNSNECFEFATVSLSKNGQIKDFKLADKFSSHVEIEQFLNPIRSWQTGTLGQIVVRRPLFALLPLKGKFQWNDRFLIRPIGTKTKIGKGLDFFASAALSQVESHLGPPFPFILEVKINKSEDTVLGYHDGLRLMTEYECLLSVLLTRHISTHRILSSKRWTSVWNESEISYHLLHGGFDTGEEGLSEAFSDPVCDKVPLFSGEDYYNHLFGGDEQVLLPPNIFEQLEAFEALPKDVRQAFLRACYWFSIGLENRQETGVSITAYSAAIECLLPRESKQKCGECGKPKGKGPTKLFKEHLEKYAPILPSLEKQRQKIYDIRSDLEHRAII
jgi:hypothetical protein